MKHIILSLFLLSFCANSIAQTGMFNEKEDTLKLGHHLGGELDSIDIAFTNHASTFVGVGLGKIENTLGINFFNYNPGGVQFRTFNAWKNMRFSALPHLGFGYVFGTKGQQYVSANYAQAFGSKILLNIDYDLHRATGFIRNSVTNMHDIQLQLRRLGNFYSFQVNGQYTRNDFGQNGGITTDSLIDVNGLGFVTVNKDNAQSRYRGTRIELDNYFDLLMKDSLRAFGIYTESQMNILNHRYVEASDTLAQIYGVINYDSISTQDQDQLSQAINTGGVYFKSSAMSAKAGIYSNYWRFANLNTLHDTLELGLDGEVAFSIRKVQLNNHTNFNFVGALQEWYTNSSLQVDIARFRIKGFANFSNLLPEQFQRFYYSNHFQNSISNMQKQFRSSINATAEYSFGKQSRVGVHVNNVNLVNNYFLINNQWRNDSIGNLNYLQVGVSMKSGYKILHVSLNGNYTIGKYVPAYLVQSRVMLQGKMFKGRKLLAQIGVEASIHSGFDVLGYLPLLDAYQFNSSQISPQSINLHAFGAFEVSTFRFFFRVENIGYVWNDSRNVLIQNYPIPAMNIRIGITWDFFN